jgi:hypothetical protein
VTAGDERHDGQTPADEPSADGPSTAELPRVHLPGGEILAGRMFDAREWTFDGRAHTLDAETLCRAIRGGGPVPEDTPFVATVAPGPVHEYVARLDRGMSFDRRGALATLARSRGHASPHADRLVSLRSALATPEPPLPTELDDARRRAADAGAETDRLRERVATLRGRVTAHRERGDDAVTAAEADLSETMRRLSEVATERVAARQRLELLETRARASRDRRERRLELEDRVGNLERDARRWLTARVWDSFRASVAALPQSFAADVGDVPGRYAGSSVAAALAVARLADVRAPVVVDADVAAPFGGPRATTAALDTPIVVV